MSESADILQKRKTLQEAMNFTAALAYGIEQIVGLGAHGMAFIAGKKLGTEFAAHAKKTADPAEALEEVRRILLENDCNWDFVVFQPRGGAEELLEVKTGEENILLVFRDCMIRESLFRFGHKQKGSLCRIMYGFFSGAIESIMGKKVQLEILHAGANACLKRLRIKMDTVQIDRTVKAGKILSQ